MMARLTPCYKNETAQSKFKVGWAETRRGVGKFQSRSKMPAAPIPPPMHMVTMP
jgi:hypothetical protein